VTMLTTGVAIVTGMAWLAMVQVRRDVDTELWSTLWLGRAGTLAFAAARRLRGGERASAPMTHRATELSLGMAAEQLYESLPRSSRQALGDLPGLLRRLQHDAQTLRTRYVDLSEVVGTEQGGDASADVQALRQERDEVHDRLTDAVGALETIRLNLLRLHAGSATVEGLTTHIGLAQEVSAEVERMIAARDEVESALRLPRAAVLAPTEPP
jgi:hypothetical protein